MFFSVSSDAVIEVCLLNWLIYSLTFMYKLFLCFSRSFTQLFFTWSFCYRDVRRFIKESKKGS